jgi:uncharacterized membrane protein
MTTNTETPKTNSIQSSPDLEPNVAGALAYFAPPFTGILFMLLESKDKFVKFHAFQSILFGTLVFAVILVSKILYVVLIGVLLVPLVYTAAFIVWLVLMWKAYNKEEYMLPYLGKIAKEQANKK